MTRSDDFTDIIMKHVIHSLVALVLILAVSPDRVRSAEPPTSAALTSIGYASVAEALAALRAKPGVTFTTQDGMTIAEDLDALTSWIFYPEGHPAYPTAIRRSLVNKPEGAYMETNVWCEAGKKACKKYFGDT